MGQEKVQLFFPSDHTHTNMAGAVLNARAVAEGIRSLRDCDLSSCFTFEAMNELSNNPVLKP